jgi:Holliday junction resolvase RusA-like endonuclease
MTKPMLTIHLNDIPPGANELHRTNRYDVGKLRAQWKQDAYRVAMNEVNRLKWRAPNVKAVVSVLFRFPDRKRRDPDNYTAGLKGVLDGLVQAGVLRDDDFGSIALQVDAQFGVKQGPELYVTVTPQFEEEAP